MRTPTSRMSSEMSVLMAMTESVLIQLIAVLVVFLERLVLLVFQQEKVADSEHIQLCTHETPEGVLRGANDRFAAHIEGRVHHKRAAGFFVKAADHGVVAGVRVLVNRLNPG